MAASIRASDIGLEIVDQARRKKGWAKKALEWCDAADEISSSTLDRFWAKRAISQKCFVAICKAVGIEDWEAIADLPPLSPVPQKQQASTPCFSTYTPATFTGRDTEIADLTQALQNGCRLLLIHGMTGIGKTALAGRLAADLTTAESYRRIVFDQGNRAQGFIPGAIAILEQLGDNTTQQLSNEEILPYLLRKLAPHPYWLQLDSVECLLDQNQAGESHFTDPIWLDFFFQVLTKPCAARFILTSQVLPIALVNRCQHHHDLSWHPYPLKGLPEEHHLDLFRNHGVTPQTEIATKHLCTIAAHFEGHPLILKMIAGDIKTSPFNGNVEKYWQDYYSLRQSQTRLKLHHSQEQNARCWISNTIRQLPPVPQQMLQRCAVFRQVVTEAFYLNMVSDLPDANSDTALTTLIDRNLVETPDIQSGQLLLRQHNLIREVAYADLKANRSTWETAERQAASLWLTTYELPSDFDPMKDTADLETVQAQSEAFHHYCEVGDWESAKRILLDQSLGTQLQNWKKYREAQTLYQRLLGHLQPLDEVVCKKQLGHTVASLGNFREASELYEQSLNLARELGDRSEEAKALGNLGRVQNWLGNYQQAIHYIQQSIDIFGELEDRENQGLSIYFLGNVFSGLGQFQQAIAHFQQYLVIAQEIKDRSAECNALYALGNTYWSFGDFQQAARFNQQYLTIAKEFLEYSEDTTDLGAAIDVRLGNYQSAIDYHQRNLVIAQENEDRVDEAFRLCNLGWTNLLIGNYEQAIDCNQKSLAIAQDIGIAYYECTTQGNLGLAYCYLGQYEEALYHNQQSLDISRRIGHRYIEHFALSNLGKVYQRLGKYQEAIELHRQAFIISQETNDIFGDSWALEGIGATLIQLENYSEALETLHKALEINQKIGHRYGEAGTLKHLAELHQALGEMEMARQFCQQALALATELGIPLVEECRKLQEELERGSEGCKRESAR